ncbi:MAG: hypothetical protein FWD37_02185 [Methanomassiliicoccaceae archaeon]|nr:hypothetical protein [Methanomassiliicoccaceae archaeon]
MPELSIRILREHEREQTNISKANARSMIEAIPMKKMPESYTLNLTGLSDSIMIGQWERHGDIVSEYLGRFEFNGERYQVSIRRDGKEKFVADIMDKNKNIVAESGTWNFNIIDQKLNESWKEYIGL